MFKMNWSLEKITTWHEKYNKNVYTIVLNKLYRNSNIYVRSIWIAQKYSKNWNNSEWLFTMHVSFISLINSILENVNKLLTMLFVKILMFNIKI